jgi:signal transduction histidine kinase
MRAKKSTAHQTAGAAPSALLSAGEYGQRPVRDQRSDDLDANTPALSHAMLNTLFMHLPGGVIVVDTAGREVFTNEAGRRLSREMLLGAGTLAGNVLLDDVVGSPPVTHGMRIARALTGDAVPDVDYVSGAQGESRHQVVQVVFTPLRDGTAQIAGVVLTLTDLTVRLAGQATLARAADALAPAARETLAQEAGTLARKAVTQAQDNRDLVRSNTELEQQATLARAVDALAEVNRETLAREAGTLALKAVTQAQDNRDLTRSNTELEHQATLARVADALAEVTRGTLARKADMLARKAVAQAQDNRDLSRSNTGLEQFASVASHDLQEPLRKIQAFGDRLKSVDGAVLSPPGAEYLERMQHAAARMQVLINDLLAFARVSTSPASVSPVDLAVVTRAVLLDLEAQVARSGGRVEVGPLPSIEANPVRMRQLLQNLISNALKFQRPEAPPIVTISAVLSPREDAEDTATQAAAYPPAWVHLTVQDNGIGFEQKHAERIFEVFKRLHGRSAYEGTGIGLALCRRIAEQHGGHITATSALGQGAVVRVTLPLRQAEGVWTA